MLLKKGGEADALATEELRGQHGVKDTLRTKLAEVSEQTQVEIAAVHQEVLGREFLPKRCQRQRGEHINEEHLAIHQKLEEAHAGAVVEHVVRLGIEGDFVHAVERGQQRFELVGCVDEGVGGKSLLVQRSGKETAKLRRTEARN